MQRLVAIKVPYPNTDKYAVMKARSLRLATQGPGALPSESETVKRDRIYNEIAALSALVHAHILPLYDWGSFDLANPALAGDDFYQAFPVMKEPLTVALDRSGGKLNPELVERYFLDLCSALGYAHTKGILHRDVKPSNVLLDESGNVVLADFGLARIVGSTTGHTEAQRGAAVFGTRDYAPPEAWSTDSVPKLTKASDVYSLGCLTYQMLVGRTPFQEYESYHLLEGAHRRARRPLPSEADSSLPAHWDHIVAKMMAIVPEERYPSTFEAVAALQEAKADIEVKRDLLIADLRREGIALNIEVFSLNDQLAKANARFTGVISLSALVARSLVLCGVAVAAFLSLRFYTTPLAHGAAFVAIAWTISSLPLVCARTICTGRLRSPVSRAEVSGVAAVAVATALVGLQNGSLDVWLSFIWFCGGLFARLGWTSLGYTSTSWAKTLAPSLVFAVLLVISTYLVWTGLRFDIWSVLGIGLLIGGVAPYLIRPSQLSDALKAA